MDMDEANLVEEGITMLNEETRLRREKALILLRMLVAQSKPPEWQPYDEYGDPVDVDVSNTDDWHSHGIEVGNWLTAAIVREALQLLET